MKEKLFQRRRHTSIYILFITGIRRLVRIYWQTLISVIWRVQGAIRIVLKRNRIRTTTESYEFKTWRRTHTVNGGIRICLFFFLLDVLTFWSIFGGSIQELCFCCNWEVEDLDVSMDGISAFRIYWFFFLFLLSRILWLIWLWTPKKWLFFSLKYLWTENI